MSATCPGTIHDGHETVHCALPDAHDGDHRRGFLAWDTAGRWYGCREFPDLYPAIGAILKEARESRGLHQQQVAASLNLTRSSIANAEAGRQRMPLHTWVAHCQTLGLDPADVISRALQPLAPGVEPLPSQGDERAARLRRRLTAARQELDHALAALPATTPEESRP